MTATRKKQRLSPPKTIKQLNDASDALVEQIVDVIEGTHPVVVGQALAEVVGMWLSFFDKGAAATDDDKAKKERVMTNFLEQVAICCAMLAATAEPEDLMP
jgi:hypothetical protein